MEKINWEDGFNGAITICNADNKIIYMNEKSIKQFSDDGGEKLIGTDIVDCHPEPSKSMLKDMINDKESNTYTITKKGTQKIIHQAPLIENGDYKGFIEISFEIPEDMPHHNRDK